MRQISALLLGAVIGVMALLGAAGRGEPIQAHNQVPPPEGSASSATLMGWAASMAFIDHDSAGLHTRRHGHQRDARRHRVERQKLGFDVKDIKVIISSHAHFDHVEATRR